MKQMNHRALVCPLHAAREAIVACRQYPPVLEVLGELVTDVDNVKHIAQPVPKNQFIAQQLQLICSLPKMALMQLSPVSRSTT